MTTLQTGFAPCGNARIYCERSGDGPPLVLIHAGIADSRMWDEHVPDFARRYRVVRYDLRGFGQSRMPAGSFAHHADLYDLLRFLGIERAILIGASYGGGVAVSFTLEHPEMVCALVLANASVPGQEWSEATEQFAEAEAEALERGDLAAATELNLRTWVDGPHRRPEQVDRRVRERVREMQARAFTLQNPAAVEEQLEPAAATRLSEIRVPTLVLLGDQDVQDIVDVGEKLAAAIPGARLARIEGAAHVPSMEQPEAFQRIVLPFLVESLASDPLLPF